jgi:protease-4
MLRSVWIRRLGFAIVWAVSAAGWATADEPKKEKTPEPPKPKVAVFRLSGAIKETAAEESFNFGNATNEPLRDILLRMNKAGKAPEVKAVVLLVENLQAGPAQIEEIRREVARVRQAGKEVYAHADEVGGIGSYALLASASRLSVVPTADLWITGLSGESPYLRGLLDKLEVQPDFLTCGAYKSAAETFMRDGPSPEADAMQNWLLDSLYDTLARRVGQGREVSPEKVREWIDGGPYTAEKAKALGIIDAVEHRQDLTALLRKKFGAEVVFDSKFGKKAEAKPDFSSPFGLLKFWGELLGGAAKPEAKKKPSVAIVHVEGPIVLGRRDASIFGDQSAASTTIRQALDDAANDDSVKAVVLRVDSPGGSAVASEVILDATRRVKAKKPLAVSMGNVAASGGYYVSCGSDTIFADEATITGSIGVVAGKVTTGKLFHKLGVNFKEYRRGKNAGILSSAHAFSPEERVKMQAWMDEIYGVFKGHVTAIRGARLAKPIDELAGGRVFTGKQAIELGLVDKIGTLDDALIHVASRAGLKDGEYEVRVIPRPKSFLELLVEDPSSETPRKELRIGPRPTLLQLAMPFLNQLDGRRAELALRAMDRLELLNREGLILMMPEFGFGR